jgi:hypothetical protein
MLPNSGSKLPNGPRPSEADYIREISRALRFELGATRAATKMIMRWTGASDRTARTWMNGFGAPNGFHLVCLARESEAVLSAVLALSGRGDFVLSADLHAVEVALAKATGALEVLKRQHRPPMHS